MTAHKACIGHNAPVCVQVYVNNVKVAVMKCLIYPSITCRLKCTRDASSLREREWQSESERGGAEIHGP